MSISLCLMRMGKRATCNQWIIAIALLLRIASGTGYHPDSKAIELLTELLGTGYHVRILTGR